MSVTVLTEDARSFNRFLSRVGQDHVVLLPVSTEFTGLLSTPLYFLNATRQFGMVYYGQWSVKEYPEWVIIGSQLVPMEFRGLVETVRL